VTVGKVLVAVLGCRRYVYISVFSGLFTCLETEDCLLPLTS